jgi:hypothetical protein
MTEEPLKAKVANLSRLVERVDGIYSQVARQLGVHRTFVSRVARGERQSDAVEQALAAEYEQIREMVKSDRYQAAAKAKGARA